MRIVILKYCSPRSSPIRIKCCSIIFKHSGSCHFISLNQRIPCRANPDTSNQLGIFKCTKCSCIKTNITINQRWYAICHNNSIWSSSFNPISTHNYMCMMNIIYKIFLLIYTYTTCSNIVNVVITNNDVMKMILSWCTTWKGNIHSPIPIHALVYWHCPSIFTIYLKDFAIRNFDSCCNSLWLCTNANSLTHTSFAAMITNTKSLYFPIAHSIK